MAIETTPAAYAQDDHGQLVPAIPAKQGHNDLSRWEAFGGTLKRPGPPAPMNRWDRLPPVVSA